MVIKRRNRNRKPAAERRIDVTRLEYQTLLELAQKNQESIRRLERMAATEFQRTVEQQAEIDALKKAMLQK